MNASPNIQFAGLNALRFISALAIVFYHSTLNFQDQFPKPVKMFIHNLPLGVDWFFIISGFLIVYLLLVEKEANGTISLSRFYIRRALRIFPLYYLIIGIAFLTSHVSHPEVNFSKYLYFFGNFWMIETDKWTIAILNPLWSLCIEEHFYLFIPFLVLIFPVKRIKYLFWSIILISIAFRIYVTLTVQFNWMTIYAHTLSRCDLLALGGLFAYYHKKYPFSLRLNWALPITALYLVLLMCAVDNSDYTDIFNATFKKYLFAAPLSFILLAVLFNQNEGSVVLNWLRENKAINYLGRISYGMYMYHSIFGDAMAQVGAIQNSMLLKPLCVIGLTILVSAVSYELLEKRILKIKSRFEVVSTSN
jgi:peptidoglycan/LPS O-acetylase OafA/YrhL